MVGVCRPGIADRSPVVHAHSIQPTKRRLIGCAACVDFGSAGRRMVHWRDVIELAERFADGIATRTKSTQWKSLCDHRESLRYCLGATRSSLARVLSRLTMAISRRTALGLLKAVRSSFEKKVRPPEYAAQAAILRDIAAIPWPSIPQRKRSLGERDGCRDCEAHRRKSGV